MGDMADYALEIASNQDAHYERFKDAPLHIQYDEGIIDEHGVTIGNPSSFPAACHSRTRVAGAGNCPKCGADTKKLTGQYGVFYGCVEFPKCNGSRKA